MTTTSNISSTSNSHKPKGGLDEKHEQVEIISFNCQKMRGRNFLIKFDSHSDEVSCQ